MKGMIPELSDLRDLKGKFDYFLGRTDTPTEGGVVQLSGEDGIRRGLVGHARHGSDRLAFSGSRTYRALASFEWAMDVATTVHFYEAILATLSIAVWHFYHVIFDPAVYPMDYCVADR